ncbi:MAG: hypothetical protein U0640_06690 [Phycisphaerales bacterium]
MSTIEKLVVFGIAGAPFFGLLPVVVIWLTSRSRPRIPRRALLFVGASSILGQVAMVVAMLVLRPLEGTSWFGVYIVIFIAVPAWFASSALGALVGAIVIQCSLLDRALGFESRR